MKNIILLIVMIIGYNMIVNEDKVVNNSYVEGVNVMCKDLCK
jgi:hypothetical protein